MCIFAKQLSFVLSQHNKRIGSLSAIWVEARNISTFQINRLRKAANGECSGSVTLSPDQIDEVIRIFKLNADDIRRLRSALIAESFSRFFSGRIDPDRLDNLTKHLFQVLYSGAAVKLDEWRDEVRLSEEEISAPSTERELQIAHDLSPAIELYEEAQLWLLAAQDAHSAARRKAYTQLATTLLTEAEEFLRYPTGVLIGAEEYLAWVEVIGAAVHTARTA